MGLLNIYDEYQKRKAMAGQPGQPVPPVVQVATTPQPQPQAGGLLGVYDRIMATQNPTAPMPAPAAPIEVPPVQSNSATENLGMPSTAIDNSAPEMTSSPQQRPNPLLDDDKKSRLRTLLSSMFM